MPSAPDFALYLLVIGAGASLALQQVVNANLRVALASPWWPGFASYFVGMLLMLVLASFAPGPRLSLAAVSRTTLPAWSGGLFGSIFIITAILTVPRLGAATVLALVVVGQMIGSLTFDQFGLLGLPQQPATLARLAGAGLLIAGVILVRT
ncbi:MAG TPA: DMT family transporter [Acetobacteraceae bacterium]|nr:DMT family transporter [Acetobacteraceae bacterium]